MAIKEKDKIIEVNALEIPEELKELPQWVLWRAEWNENNNNLAKYRIALVVTVQAQPTKIRGRYLMLSIDLMKIMKIIMESDLC